MLNNKLTNNKRLVRRKNLSNSNITLNTMRRETIIPLAIGLLLGALIMVFVQFNNRLNNNAIILSQLEQATAANTKNVTDVINFINQAQGGAQAAGQGAATTPAQ
jgi:uncharacterized membrane protein YvbJ